jgi:multidrug efflux system membrane fusion protein
MGEKRAMRGSTRAAAVVVAAGLVLGCRPPAPSVQPPEPPTVTVAHPVERELDSFTEFTGYLKAVESVEVRAQVTGYLKTVYFENMQEGFRNGGLVKEGDKLYEIDPEPYEAALKNAEASVSRAKSDVAAAVITERRAKADVERAEPLEKKKTISGEEFDRYRAAYDTAATTLASSKAAVLEAEARLRKAQFDHRNCTIRSEVKGTARTSRTNVTRGNLIRAGETVLCRITSLEPIHAIFDIDETTSLAYRRRIFDTKEIPDPRDPRYRLKCELGTKDEVGYPHKGVVDYIAPEIVRGTGTREVRGVFPNPDYRLSPGDSIRIRVEAGKPRKSITVPEIAVGSQQRQKFVYVVNNEDEVVYRPIILGGVREVNGLRLQIVESGVTTVDRIVVNGLLRVRPGVKVQPKTAGDELAIGTAKK